MNNSEQIFVRLKEKSPSGCSAIVLRALKCDLSKLLGHYMSVSEIDLNVKPMKKGSRLCIDIDVDEFYSVGK